MSIEHNDSPYVAGLDGEAQADTEPAYEILEIGQTAVLDSLDAFDPFFQVQTEAFRAHGYRQKGSGLYEPFDTSAVKGRAMWIDEFKKPKGVYGGSTGRVLCTRLDARDIVPGLLPEAPSFGMNIVVEGLSSRRQDAPISYLSGLDLVMTRNSSGYAGEVLARYVNKTLKGDLRRFEREHNQTIENALALARVAIQNPLQGGRADGNK